MMTKKRLQASHAQNRIVWALSTIGTVPKSYYNYTPGSIIQGL